MQLRRYALATMLGIVPAAIIYSGVGAGLGALLKRGEQPDLGIIFEWHILLPLLGLGALCLLPVVYCRLRRPAPPPGDERPALLPDVCIVGGGLGRSAWWRPAQPSSASTSC